MTTQVDIPAAAGLEVARPFSARRRASGLPSRLDPWRAAPVLVAAAISLVYMIVQPRTVDLAASVFRAQLFGEAGFTIWNNSWYGGHPTWSYSVLVPPLAWLLSPALLCATSTIASAALFEALARRHWGAEASRWGTLWFGAAAASPMLSGRVTFAVGVTGALASLLALQRGRRVIACLLALVCALLSPIAGLFLALAALAYALTVDRLPGLFVTAAALAPPALVSLVFPDGHVGPFVLSAFWAVPLFTLAFYAALPRRARTLRAAARLYALATVAAFVLPTPMGGNVVRLGALVGGPLLMMSRRRFGAPAVALLVAFGVWQWSSAVRDLAQTAGDPATQTSFYRPLNKFLSHAGGPPFRVEIPFTFSHWESAEVAPHFPLARGWLRPDDAQYNHLFYDGTLNASTYRRWLEAQGVRFVAVPRAKPDYSARSELQLIASRPPYLRRAWASHNWTVYEVTARHSAGLAQLGVNDAVVKLRRRGSVVVRVRWSPYWSVRGACVAQAGDWTRVIAAHAGSFQLQQSFSVERTIDQGKRCS